MDGFQAVLAKLNIKYFVANNLTHPLPYTDRETGCFKNMFKVSLPTPPRKRRRHGLQFRNI